MTFFGGTVGTVPQKLPNKGREQAFSSQSQKILKLAYNQNYRIDSNQILHSDKDHQNALRGWSNNSQQIHDGGRPSWKIEKSPYLGRGLTDFDEIWHGDVVWPF